MGLVGLTLQNQSLQPYGFIRNFYGNDLSITEYGNRLNFTEVGIIWKIFDMALVRVLVVL